MKLFFYIVYKIWQYDGLEGNEPNSRYITEDFIEAESAAQALKQLRIQYPNTLTNEPGKQPTKFVIRNFREI